jgi:hypothetical protein
VSEKTDEGAVEGSRFAVRFTWSGGSLIVDHPHPRTITIGSDEGCDLRLPAKDGVLARHARLQIGADGRVWLEWVGGLGRFELVGGINLGIGNCRVRVDITRPR